MPIVVVDNFIINKAEPIDSRIVATNSTARASIQYKYDGLQVFQTDNRLSYTWNASYSYWETDIAPNLIVGTGTNGFITTWTGTSSVSDTMIYQTQTATLGGYKVGKVGINTPPSGAFSLKEALQVNASYSGGEAPPIVVHKGSNSIIAENWYYTTTEQTFVSNKGSSLIEFNDGTLSVRTRKANNPSTTYNKLKVTDADIEISSYEGGTPPIGTIMASIAARSLTYNSNLSAIKFLASGTAWSGGNYPTDIVFYSMSGATQYRSGSIKDNGAFIIGGNSTHSNDKLLVQGRTRIQDVLYAEKSIETAAIKFPSTATASSDVNTLDDYEEGTVSIVNFINLYDTALLNNILFGAAGGVVTNGNLKYVKVGTAVTISGWMTLDWSAISSPTHGARFVEFSLPFAPSGSSQGGIGVHIVCPQWSVNPSAPYGGTICIQSVSGNPAVLKYHKFGSAVAEPTVSNFKNLNAGICDLFITFTYISNQ